MSNLPPPPPPIGGGSYPPPPPPSGSSAPTIKIGDWFNEAFDRIKPAWVDYFVAGLVLMLVGFVAMILCYIPYLIVGGPLAGGLYIFVAKKMLGLPTEVGDVFKGFRKFTETLLLFLVMVLPPLVVYLIAWLPMALANAGMGRVSELLGSIGGCIGCVGIPIFGIIYPLVVGTLCMFAFPLVMFGNMDAMAALKKSVDTVKPNFVNFGLLLLSFVLVFFVAELAGLIACFIGILVTVPVAACVIIMVQLEAYREYFGLSADSLTQYN